MFNFLKLAWAFVGGGSAKMWIGGAVVSVVFAAVTAAAMHYNGLIKDNAGKAVELEAVGNKYALEAAQNNLRQRAIEGLLDVQKSLSDELDAAESRRVSMEKRLNDLEIAKNFGFWAESDPVGFGLRMRRGTNRMLDDIEQASGGAAVAGVVSVATGSADDHQAKNRTAPD